jgi:hypothetical protein
MDLSPENKITEILHYAVSRHFLLGDTPSPNQKIKIIKNKFIS